MTAASLVAARDRLVKTASEVPAVSADPIWEAVTDIQHPIREAVALYDAVLHEHERNHDGPARFCTPPCRLAAGER